MLDMGFEPQINEILHDTNLPRSIQKVLSSATFPSDVMALATRFMGGSYVKITLPSQESASTSLITQDVRYCREVDKLIALKSHLNA